MEKTYSSWMTWEKPSDQKEYLHETPKARARTLFATHYHELNEMEKNFSRIRNYNVSVRELDGKVIFLRKLERGGSEHSFGIHVAEIAGMPRSIVKRANVILKELEKDNSGVGKAAKPTAASWTILCSVRYATKSWVLTSTISPPLRLSTSSTILKRLSRENNTR